MGVHSRSHVCVNTAQLERWGLLQLMCNVQLPRGRQRSSSQPLCSCRDFSHCVCVILCLIIAPEGYSTPFARNLWVLACNSWGNGFPQLLSALEDLYTRKRSLQFFLRSEKNILWNVIALQNLNKDTINKTEINFCLVCFLPSYLAWKDKYSAAVLIALQGQIIYIWGIV